MRHLANDLDLLTELHEQVLQEAGQGDLVEVLRRFQDPDGSDDGDLAPPRGPDQVAAVSRAATVRLHLTNLADERHRARSLRTEDGEHGGSVDTGDVGPTVGSVGPQARDRFARMCLHPVLTAHPTEARRRAVTTALRRLAEQLDRHADPTSGPAERAFARRRMLEDIDILHRTSTLRTTRPQPVDEVSTVLSIFDTTVFRALPRFQRAVEAALAAQDEGPVDQELPSLVRYGSWVGGDRDGNPHVTAEVTRATMEAQAGVALRTLQANVERVARTLTMDEEGTPPSAALREALANDAVALPGDFAGIAKDSPSEPHRQKLLVVAHRLEATAQGAASTAYTDPEELLADLALVRTSLRDAGDRRAADGELLHLVWLVQTFGFHLAELEVRQHSGVHVQALVELLGHVRTHGATVDGRPVDEPERAARDPQVLDALARHGWPIALPELSPATREVLDTLRVMSWLQHRWGVRCCGRYIVSFSQGADHLVAVRALARLAVGDRPLRLDVVPLFETGEDLRAAGSTLEEWLALPSTRSWLEERDRRVEVMMGYSDSAKDIGPAAATLTLHRSQQQLVSWAARHDVELTIFHGRGGSLGRGGGPLHRAITAQPTGSVDGRLKVTEQGEVIYARYADVRLAQQHLERMASAVLLADSPDVVRRRERAGERHAALGERLELASRTAYRDLMDTGGIADLVAEASPLDVLGDLRLGSRPARRGAGSGRSLADLRAIPWVFAWSMTRVNLPGWYGLGTALAAETDRDALRAAYREWPVLSSMLDVAEMSLAKSHEELAGEFLDRAGRPELTATILAEMRRTREQVLDVLGQTTLLEHKPHLRTAVERRQPLIDALSRVQLRCLEELDATGADTQEGRPWHRALLLTISGMAAGLQNTG
ncbi:phosphoenolpyruvate carboxylase [Ornithinimicrobium sp. CNJ-824]|uniref:phosphoenolpyruvate carboxylase n=1 Tax=Ornithinimicrobium sp. CNJ-824 TaxID=1904966 RepID=UPI000964C3E7|nr:phosphoenolpyruvate carboxylase [Ornithinimicrobium sp. CNJ-824]OLT22818.1 phosphoenolpyruvate carboxylase [Ornithinimicrobium sp. CNJ-824]